MGDNPKQRGLQHHKSKHKNKPKSAQKAPQNPRQPPKLESNWDQYKEIEDDVPRSSYIPAGENFSLLANAPISKGSHFQFKADAGDEFFLGNATSDTTGLFNLDLNLLALSIASIPFHERCGIPESYFTPTHHHFMKQSAKNSAQLYEQSLLKLGYTIDGDKEKEIFSHKEFLENFLNYHTDQLKEPNKLINDATEVLVMNESIKDKLKKDFEKICPLQIEKLNELEEKLERVTLTKQDLKGLEEHLLIQPSGMGCSGDESIYRYGNDSIVSTNTKDSSLLETESLEEWLDDVLED